MRASAFSALLLALGACTPEEPETPAAAADAPSPWSLQASATAGAAIILSDDTGAERLRIACRRNPAELYVSAPAFTRIGSEERLTLGAGDELATLVVSQETPPGRPLEAVGQLSADFVDAFAAGRAIAASYGASAIGPAPSPPPHLRASFAAACREALSGR